MTARAPLALGLAGIIVAGMAWATQPAACADASCSVPIATLQAQLAADQAQIAALQDAASKAQSDTSTLKLYMAQWYGWTGTTHTDGWNLDDMQATPSQRDVLIALDAQVRAEAPPPADIVVPPVPVSTDQPASAAPSPTPSP